MVKYLVVNDKLTNEKTKKTFFRDDTITDKDFPKGILVSWALRGYIVAMEEKPSGRNNKR